MEYYVYEWYIKETGEVIYVGKGTRNRYKVRKHNKFFTEMLKRFECDSRIIKSFDTEQDAFSYEYKRIEELKTKGQCVCNIYQGGFGGSTSDWTERKRLWYSEHNTMKSEAQRKRMSEKNPMKNPETAKKVGLSKRKAVVIGNDEYESVTLAAKARNTDTGTIKGWCEKGINAYNEICRYKDSDQIKFTGKRYNKGGCREIQYKGIVYETPKDMAEELGLSVDQIYRWAKKGFDPYGNVCRYTDDKRELTFSIKPKAHHPVIVNGIHYKTIAESARANGVSAQTISDILNHKYVNTKFICEYDNQQPSQGNTNNSTLEGSETNG